MSTVKSIPCVKVRRLYDAQAIMLDVQCQLEYTLPLRRYFGRKR